MIQYDTMITNISEQFYNNNWTQTIPKPGHIIFKKIENNCDIIELKMNSSITFYVTVPIKFGHSQYTTRFDLFEDAINYIIMHLQNYEKN